MFLIKVKTIKFQNSTILIKNFFKILFFLLIISCSSNDYNTEFPNQNNDEEDEELGEGEDSRSAIDKALGKSKKGLSRSLRIMKKHRAEITVVLILFAFRREVAMIISSVAADGIPAESGTACGYGASVVRLWAAKSALPWKLHSNLRILSRRL